MLEGAQAVYLCHYLVRLNEGYIKQLLLVCRMEGKSGRITFRFKIRAIPGIWWCIFTFSVMLNLQSDAILVSVTESKVIP